MLGLRPFKKCDAEMIATWCRDEGVYKRWGGHLIGSYPLSAADIIEMYIDKNGMCEEADNFYAMTAFDDEGPVVSLILRYLNGDRKFIRFGWIIVDGNKRGKGYGKKMIRQAFKYAFEILQAEKVCLGVYENNPAAQYCYKAAGFRPSTDLKDKYVDIDGEQWKVIELEITRKEYEETE